jgi:ceramide glucosyltransferase
MISSCVTTILLVVAALPFIYYLIALYSSWQFFRLPTVRNQFTPPVSILKAVRGLDPDAYENFASFCRQDYPEYEVLFCVDENDDLFTDILERISHDFPETQIRVLSREGGSASNDKIAKLVRMVGAAQYEIIVMADSDVRVQPDYLRAVVSPLADPNVGATTCFYMPVDTGTIAENLHAIGMVSDFYAGILVARQLDGVKFALGPTIVTRRANLAEFGGLRTIENLPGDDLLVGRLIAGSGHEVVLLPHVIRKLAGYQSLGDVFDKRLRWMTVMRHMRPWGHLGLLLTLGLPWCLLAFAIHPSPGVALAYFGTYLCLRFAMAWSIGIRGLKQPQVWKKMLWIPVWDAFAFMIWLASSLRKSIRWRGGEYYIRDGKLCPASPSPVKK